MKPRPKIIRSCLLAGLLAGAALPAAGPAADRFTYTKRVETNLLAEPRPLAASAGKLAYGRKLKVEEVQGSWLRVSDGPVTGWVFAGNVSETKPAEGKGLDGLGLAASKTTATAAARPLTPAGEDYAKRRKLTSARDDLTWLLAEAYKVTEADVEQFLQEQGKGEYR